jgi:A/G-specific adenine glycosylase
LPKRPKKEEAFDYLTESDLIFFHKSLISWYRVEGRTLPWRQTRDPYRIWVSEILLQQTQVATVLPYFHRFTKRFPTVQALAQAKLQDVLKSWEGLGYYARARNLHRAAREVIRRWNGKIPSDPALLQSLPGVGRSTAGAISSLAFARQAAILDGNLRRVFARLLAIETPLNNPSIQQRLWNFSERILPRNGVAAFNQALMDLGATVCTPKKPACLRCPVESLCLASRKGIQQYIPARVRKKTLPHHHLVTPIIFRAKRILVVKREAKGLLGGLWGLPEVCIKNPSTPPQIRQALLDRFGLHVTMGQRMKCYDHTFSHFRMTYHPYLCQYVSGSPAREMATRWILPQALSELPFSSAMHRILAQLPQFTAAAQIPRAQVSVSVTLK